MQSKSALMNKPSAANRLCVKMSKMMMAQLANPRVMTGIMQLIKRNTPEGEKIDIRELFNSFDERE